MAKIIYAGGELESVAVTAGSVSEDTTSGSFDSNYSRCALALGNSVFNCKFIDQNNAAVNVVTGETLFFHTEFFTTGTSTSVKNIIEFVNSSNQPWLALRSISGNSAQLCYNSNTGASPTWTSLYSWGYASSARYILDIKITLGSPHSVEFFVNNASVYSGTFTQALLTALASANFSGIGASFAWFSQMMAAEGRSTVGGKCRQRAADGAGASAGWTGVYTDINEMPLSDANALVAGSAGLKSTFTYQDLTVPAGLAIAAVFLQTRAKNDGLAPLNLNAVCRSGGTDYASGNLPGMGSGFAPISAQWPTNPSGGAAWDATSFNAAQFGVQSAT